jgi:hypothetical protein
MYFLVLKCVSSGGPDSTRTDRTLFCPGCKTTVDRDVNAARNIAAKGGVRFAPEGPAGEAMVQEPSRQEKEAILRVDAGKLADAKSCIILNDFRRNRTEKQKTYIERVN